MWFQRTLACSVPSWRSVWMHSTNVDLHGSCHFYMGAEPELMRLTAAGRGEAALEKPCEDPCTWTSHNALSISNQTPGRVSTELEKVSRVEKGQVQQRKTSKKETTISGERVTEREGEQTKQRSNVEEKRNTEHKKREEKTRRTTIRGQAHIKETVVYHINR